MNYLVRDRDVIFNLAGQVSHIDSMRDPYTDLEINCRSQLTLLEACRHHNPSVKVVFAGTRQVYGRPDSLPVDRDAPGAADRRQRHQQGRRRVLPPRLQQRLRRARLLAAADQRLRPAPADPTQPPGLHRLVHPAGDRGPRRSRSSATARSCATSSTSTMRPTRSCAPARATRATARCSTSAATSRSAIAISSTLLVEVAGTGPRRVRRLAGGEEGDRHRQLLRRLDASSRARTGWAPTVTLRDGLRADDRVLPRSTSTATSTPPAAPARRMTPCRDPVHVARARRGRGRRARGDRARRSRSGWFVLGPGGRGVRSGVRRGDRAPRTRSASAPAPTRSR